MGEVHLKGQAAKLASYSLVGVSTEEKNEALNMIADQLMKDLTFLLTENQKDIQQVKKMAFQMQFLIGSCSVKSELKICQMQSTN